MLREGQKSGAVVLTCHSNADFDALGSLALLARALPHAAVLFPHARDAVVQDAAADLARIVDPSPSSSPQRWFSSAERLAAAFLLPPPGGADRPREGPSVHATSAAVRPPDVVVVDTHSADRLQHVPDAWLLRAALVLDHHVEALPPGASPLACALDAATRRGRLLPCGSCVAVVMLALGPQQCAAVLQAMTPFERTLVYAGVWSDTLGFSTPATSPEDLDAAAAVLRAGIDRAALADMLRSSRAGTPAAAAAAAAAAAGDAVGDAAGRWLRYEMARTLAVHRFGAVDVGVCRVVSVAEEPNGGGDALSRLLEDAPHLAAAFCAVESERRVVLIGRARDSALVDVARVCAHFGGGGHPAAASASLRGEVTVDEVVEELHAQLAAQLSPEPLLSAMLTRAPVAVAVDLPTSAAVDLFRRRGLKRAPVVDGIGAPVGVVDAQTAERALRLGLGADAVSHWMSVDLRVVRPADGRVAADEAAVALVRGAAPMVAVVDTAGVLAGVATRTDAFHFFLRAPSRAALFPSAAASAAAPDKYPPSRVRALMQRLPAQIRDVLHDAARVGDELGCEVSVVGGFVRDLLLGLPNDDVDLVVEGVTARLFADRLAAHYAGGAAASGGADAVDGCARHHDAFQTAVVEGPHGLRIDVASARTEEYATPAALPVVELSSLKLDLFRRDFSINAMAVRLSGARHGELADFFDGVADLDRRHCRVLHALSFVDDPTRLFRAARFSARYDLELAPHTRRLALTAVERGFVAALSGARVLRELRKILRERQPERSLDLLRTLGVLRAAVDGLIDGAYSPPLMVRTRELLGLCAALPGCPPPDIGSALFLALLYHCRADTLARLLDRCSVQGRPRTAVLDGVRGAHNAGASVRRWAAAGGAEPRHVLRAELAPLPMDAVVVALAAAELKWPDEAVPIRAAVVLYWTGLSAMRVELDGREMLALGVPKGPEVARLRARLLDAKLDGQLPSKEAEAAQLVAWLRDR